VASAVQEARTPYLADLDWEAEPPPGSLEAHLLAAYRRRTGQTAELAGVIGDDPDDD
jgi:hypothetical protein